MDEYGSVDQNVVEKEKLPRFVGAPARFVQDAFADQDSSRRPQRLARRSKALLHILDAPLVGLVVSCGKKLYTLTIFQNSDIYIHIFSQ